MKRHTGVILTGAVGGLTALALTALGNPANMGLCVACFLRDIAGAFGLHSAAAVQYARPEIAGLVLGAFGISLAQKEFRPRGGSSPFTRFVLGMAVMVGALMFLGCPLRMTLRIGGGDFNAVIGLAGFIAGIGVGAVALSRGFSLRRAYPQSTVEGGLYPVMTAGLVLLLLAFPALLVFSREGPGSLRAPVAASLLGGLLLGAAAQRSRMCTAGGIRDAMLFGDFHLLCGPVALIAVVLAGNLALGQFHPGFTGQPIAHADGLWNFLGMALVGWGSVLLGGCPFRQLILAGEGSSDAAAAVLGLIAGAALCHNLGLASSASGPTANGRAAVLIGFAVVAAITLMNLAREGTSHPDKPPQSAAESPL